MQDFSQLIQTITKTSDLNAIRQLLDLQGLEIAKRSEVGQLFSKREWLADTIHEVNRNLHLQNSVGVESAHFLDYKGYDVNIGFGRPGRMFFRVKRPIVLAHWKLVEFSMDETDSPIYRDQFHAMETMLGSMIGSLHRKVHDPIQMGKILFGSHQSDDAVFINWDFPEKWKHKPNDELVETIAKNFNEIFLPECEKILKVL